MSYQIEFFDSDDTDMVYNILVDDVTCALGFDPDVSTSCYFQFNFPKTFSLTKNIIFTLIYDMTTAYSGNIKLDLSYDIYKDNNSSYSTNITHEVVAVPAIALVKQVHTTSTLLISHVDFTKAGQEIVCKLTRNISVTNNHTGVFRLIGLTLGQ